MSQSLADPSPMPSNEGKETSPIVHSQDVSTITEEVDVWWGSYSGLALAPSTLACVVLTGFIGLGSWLLLQRGWMQLAFLALSGAVWLIQGLRWGYRYFSCNYRLTTRRVFREKGFLFPEYLQISLTHISKVEVKQSGLEPLLGVGRVILHREDLQPPLVLEGASHPHEIAALIREYHQRARHSEECKVPGTK